MSSIMYELVVKDFIIKEKETVIRRSKRFFPSLRISRNIEIPDRDRTSSIIYIINNKYYNFTN